MGCGCSRELTPSEAAIEERDVASHEMAQKLEWYALLERGVSEKRKKENIKEYRRDWKDFNGRRNRHDRDLYEIRTSEKKRTSFPRSLQQSYYIPSSEHTTMLVALVTPVAKKPPTTQLRQWKSSETFTVSISQSTELHRLSRFTVLNMTMATLNSESHPHHQSRN
ncbi:hypothetical protein BDP81DRAFT_507413 [Colletotrichum phormii]|uniref:Uncharacterized protein n=1 Tax=Colletotrichum phormii TaxID=359342 RepID=A0AAI9ZDZ9_9PEZI|nr:uncharacterized protein BDP81DRAFT_507413 [Colletotrichum phormii]KAK1622468.1 hypothetical protein BDP81DRAFT_507413 [Colletotrichum phormii]